MALSKAKKLSRDFGGTWKYDGCTTWWCDDDQRHVARVSIGLDVSGEPLSGCAYWLYEKGKSPIHIDWYCTPLDLGHFHAIH